MPEGNAGAARAAQGAAPYIVDKGVTLQTVEPLGTTMGSLSLPVSTVPAV